MQLAINYSLPAAALVSSGDIKIDRFKCPPWSWMIAEARRIRPVAIHFDLQAGNGQLTSVLAGKANAIENFLLDTGTPYVNLHLEVRTGYIAGVTPVTSDPTVRQQALDYMLDDVQAAITAFGADRVIIENVPYRAEFGKVLRPSVEPDLISYIVESTQCGLLFDLSHARISAHYLGMNERAYITQLPVGSIREMHFTGVTTLDGVLTDHLEAMEEDWQALEWVIECIQTKEWGKPWMAAFEYGGVGKEFEWRSEPAVIASQLPRLYQLAQSI